ncbi:MAG: helix-turn-helix domain-containing protein [Streptococcaceae bacterium]|jgi:transcriptional regulator with XRE-family HTH domain|nr:helix-turn-helix domain-containing protein [Streptococcaceae bacterium]
MAKNIGEIIKEERVIAGLSQVDLANEIHVSRQAISRWENGINIPDIENIQLLSEFFGKQLFPIDDIGTVEVYGSEEIPCLNLKDLLANTEKISSELSIGYLLTIGFIAPVIGIPIVVCLYSRNKGKPRFERFFNLLLFFCLLNSFFYYIEILTLLAIDFQILHSEEFHSFLNFLKRF